VKIVWQDAHHIVLKIEDGDDPSAWGLELNHITPKEVPDPLEVQARLGQ